MVRQSGRRQEGTIAAQDLEGLSTKLGRPASALSAFDHLTADQVRFLSDAIDETVARRRRGVDEAFQRAIPAGRLVLAILRGRAR